MLYAGVDEAVKNGHVDTAGFVAHNPPETKNTAATATVTRDKRLVVFLFHNISEVNFLHAK
jgi:hypothetical protein